jgi:hypothetical protein
MGEIPGELVAGERRHVMADDDPLRERLVHGHGEPGPQFGLAEEHETEAVLGIHLVIREKAEVLVLEDIRAQVVGLVDHQDGPDAVAGASRTSGGTRCCCRAVAISIATLNAGCASLRHRAGRPRPGAGRACAPYPVRPRLERVEADAAIGVEPIAQRLGGHAAPRAAGDLVLTVGFFAQLRLATGGGRAADATDRRSTRSETTRPPRRGRSPATGADEHQS